MVRLVIDEESDDDEPPPPLEPPKPERVFDPPPPLDDEPPVRAAAGVTAAVKPKGGDGLTGLKKGFLSGGGSSKPKAKRAPAAPEIPMLRPTDPAVAGRTPLEARLGGLRLSEVQDNLRESASKGQGGGWVTENLLAQMAADPVLAKGLTDPSLQAVMSDMQTDPKGAMARHGTNPAVAEFILRFMRLMASHCGQLGAVQQPQQQPVRIHAEAEPALMRPAQPSLPAGEDAASVELANRALADPALRAILEDADVQAVLKAVQEQNMRPVERLMHRPDMVAKLRVLASAGLVQMSWSHC
jgi:hypothetical protein